MKNINIGALIITLFIPLVVGGISATLSGGGMAVYGSMNKPPLSPPAWLFPVAWTILYIMMGAASYFVFVSDSSFTSKAIALTIYAVQLFMNFMWSIVFFNWSYYLFAFIWLIIMWGLVIFCAIRFGKISWLAGCLLIPYILWLTFAAYLNMGAYVLNQR